MSGGQASGRSPAAAGSRHGSAFVVLYLGLLALLLVEQFVVRLPVLGYLDVVLLFGAVNVVLALKRARAGLRSRGTLYGAVLGVLPVALVSTSVGAVIVAASVSEPAVVAITLCGLAFLIAFVGATAGLQYLYERRRRHRLDGA